MPYLIPAWRPFLTLTSESESASASVCCSFSFATLEVACCRPGRASFALIEQRQPDARRWAICSPDGAILSTGCETTQSGAKRVAEEALPRDEDPTGLAPSPETNDVDTAPVYAPG